MPNPDFGPPGHYGFADQAEFAGGYYEQDVSQLYGITTESQESYFASHGVPTTSGQIVPAYGRHIFLEDDPTQVAQDESTTDWGSMNQDSLQIVRAENAPSGRVSSIATPSAHSSGTNTFMASTASSVTLSESPDRDYLQRHPKAVDASRMNQIQLFSDFLEMHFPSPEAKADLANRKSYLMGLPEIDLSSAPMLRSAVEAICYAHAGANHKDQRFIQASQKAYGRVLNSLVRCINSSSKQNDPRIIIPSIMLLTMYDDSLPEAKSAGWRSHYWGVHEYLRASGPSAFSMSEPFSRMLFLNLRVPTMFLGIARRKGVVLSEPKWRALGNVTGLGATPLGRLYPRALQLPGLLEKTDTFLRKNTYNDAKQLMRELMGLRGELLTWSMTESSFADKTIKYFTPVDASEDDVFDFDIEEHLVMSSNTTFESLFDFSSYKVAQDYALYWIFALILDCALLRILYFRPDTEAFIKPRTGADTQRDAATRAKYLCRSAYYFAKFDSQGITSFLDATVALAESFFTETSALKELGWCQSIRVANQMRLKRLREKQPKTLCRLGDMVADLALSTRFKTRNIASET